MKKKEEIAQLDRLSKKTKKHVKNFLNTRDQEELHQFRVQVKKLKALITLYACEKGNKNLLKHFKPVQNIFKKAGTIRNAYINLKLGQKYQLNDEGFNQHQQQLLNNGSEVFKKKGSKYLKGIKKARMVLQNNIHLLHNKTIRNFYQDKLAKTDTFFKNPTFNEELHTARKNIKLMIYNQKIAAPALQNKVHLNYTYLDELQNNIGEWHDHNLAMEMLIDIGKAEDEAITELKNSNADLEKTIIQQSRNFKEKVSATEEAVVEN